MHTIKEGTTLVGVSELRTRLEKILDEAKHSKVVLEKRNKPVAVIMAIERYNAMEELIDLIEDHEFYRLARSREKRSSPKDYISLAEALRKAG